ncbi:hypothetical protein HDIA_3807 [Hartmannibacter diazotrophicus]|uniref:Uncharacterized protein n=1 Tax=Hartmannibacter diazotrophicus TaxID=1482074 RepID=A0A2C9DB39_9HYPH|nr:DUF1178 family protein [Hartmannibacter diazotrophicus]SON57348.1 hypothetical protein HDIA_3807 [Hartmannibacter diazotrophicus]
MIRYQLTCIEGHGFDGWFRSSADFDDQEARGLLACPMCGSSHVKKALMAPSVVASPETARRQEAESGQTSGSEAGPAAEPAAMPVPAPTVALPSATTEKMAEMISALREIRQKLVENSEDVGSRFPEEARRIHYGEAPQRGIHGAASPEDAKALADEGIDILALPMLPEDRN